jgi:hypothetical protein
MKFHKLCQNITNCPPVDKCSVITDDMTVFRLSERCAPDVEDFKSHAELGLPPYPASIVEGKADLACRCCAISFFTSRDKASKIRKSQVKSGNKMRESRWKYLLQGVLTTGAGIYLKDGEHIDFWLNIDSDQHWFVDFIKVEEF